MIRIFSLVGPVGLNSIGTLILNTCYTVYAILPFMTRSILNSVVNQFKQL